MNADFIPKGPRLFRFAVIADTHINQSDDSASSFFELNRLANGRAAAAIPAANRYKPDFVIHLGDIVHPLPSHPGYGRAARNYRDLVSDISCPIYLTPGNHDIGDKPWPLAPVAQIDADAIAAYEKEFGPQWSSWRHGNCHFFIINTSLLNSGLPQEEEQRRWFEESLAHATGRKFLSLHYPPYVMSCDERSHYDNIDEPARSWLLSLIDTHSVEAVFCGHVHNLWYDQFNSAELYLLPSTAFVRQDYSEMQRVQPPGPEGGRQDADKLGFFVIDIHERGHVAAFVRLPEAGSAGDDAAVEQLIHSKRPLLPNLGIDPAYPWAEEITIPPSGALDAFDSKVVRNDYPIFAAMELGVCRLRLSLADLVHGPSLERFRKLARIGFKAQVVMTALPTEAQHNVLRALGSALDSIEVVGSETCLKQNAESWSRLVNELSGATLILSKLRSPDDATVDGLHYGHLVFHGWVPQEADKIKRLREAYGTVQQVQASYRVRFCQSPLDTATEVRRSIEKTACQGALLLRLATDNPAEPQHDESALLTYVAEAVIAAALYPDMRITFDALIDFDRGYFVRKGFFDRSFNPRSVVPLWRNLSILLGQSQTEWKLVSKVANAATLRIALSGRKEDITIVVSDTGAIEPEPSDVETEVRDIECWDLLTGQRLDAHEPSQGQAPLLAALYRVKRGGLQHADEAFDAATHA